MFDQKAELPRSMRWLKISVALLAVLMVCLLGFLAYGMYFQKDQSEVKAEVSPVAEASQSAVSGLVVDEGVTWQKPQKLADLGLFEKVNEESHYSNTDYYKVGTIKSGNDIVLAIVHLDAPRYPNFHRFIGRSGEYKHLVKNSDDFDDQAYGLTDKVETEGSYVFKSLLPDPVIQNGTTQLVSSPASLFYPEARKNVNKKKVGETKWGSIYIEFTSDTSSFSANQDIKDKKTMLKIARYYILLNDSTQLNYDPRPDFLLDDGTLDIDYSLNSASGESFTRVGYGCDSGSGNYCAAGLGNFGYWEYPITDEDRVEIGKYQGESVYTVQKVDHELMKHIYGLYRPEGLGEDASINDFATSFPFVYWIDAYGSPLLYTNKKFPLVFLNEDGWLGLGQWVL